MSPDTKELDGALLAALSEAADALDERERRIALAERMAANLRETGCYGGHTPGLKAWLVEWEALAPREVRP